MRVSKAWLSKLPLNNNNIAFDFDINDLDSMSNDNNDSEFSDKEIHTENDEEDRFT